MAGVFIGLLEWILSKLPAWLSRWYWTEEKLSRNVKFDLRPRTSPIEIWFSDGGKLEIILKIENRNSIPIVIDRILGSFTFESKVGPINLQFLERVRLPAGAEKDHIELFAELSSYNRKRLWGAFKDTSWRARGFLKYRLEIDTKFRSFTKADTLESISHFDPINIPDSVEDIN